MPQARKCLPLQPIALSGPTVPTPVACHARPSVDVAAPAFPTATKREPFQAISERALSPGWLTSALVQVTPSDEVNAIAWVLGCPRVLPTATNWLPDQMTALRVAWSVPGAAPQLTPSGEGRIIPSVLPETDCVPTATICVP